MICKDDFDALILDAANLLIENESTSISLLKRNLKIGNKRAVRLIRELNQLGVIGAILPPGRGYILNVFIKFKTEDELFNYKKLLVEKEDNTHYKTQLNRQAQVYRNFKDLINHGDSELFFTVFPLDENERVEKAIEFWNNEIANDEGWVDDDFYSKDAIEKMLDEAIEKRDINREHLLKKYEQQQKEEQLERSKIYNWQCNGCGSIVQQNEQPICQKCNSYLQKM